MGVRALLTAVIVAVVVGCVSAGGPVPRDSPDISASMAPSAAQSSPTIGKAASMAPSAAPDTSEGPDSPVEDILPALSAYAEQHRDEFGGLYLDQANGGAVVTLWTGHLADHEAAIRKLIPGNELVAFRQVRYTEAELRALQDRATTDMAWLREIAAAIVTASVDVVGNTIEIGISSANPDAVRLVQAHFGVPNDMLRVVSDGTGIALRRPGSVVGHLRDAAGGRRRATPMTSKRRRSIPSVPSQAPATFRTRTGGTRSWGSRRFGGASTSTSRVRL